MAIQDIRSGLKQLLAMVASISSNTTTNGVIIDTLGYDFGLTLSVACTGFTDGAVAFQIQEGSESDLSDGALLASNKLNGDLASLALTAATSGGDTMADIGIVGNKRYIRLQAVSTGVSTGLDVVAVATQKSNLAPE